MLEGWRGEGESEEERNPSGLHTECSAQLEAGSQLGPNPRVGCLTNCTTQALLVTMFYVSCFHLMPHGVWLRAHTQY